MEIFLDLKVLELIEDIQKYTKRWGSECTQASMCFFAALSPRARMISMPANITPPLPLQLPLKIRLASLRKKTTGFYLKALLRKNIASIRSQTQQGEQVVGLVVVSFHRRNVCFNP